jgi:hypothetical protein
VENEIKHIRRKRIMKLSIFEEYGGVGITKSHLRINLMKLNALGEYAE